MSSINDGGPAFPVSNPDQQTFASKTVDEVKRLMSGMSLRDHLAGLAMQGELSAMQDDDIDGLPLDTSDEQLWRLARHWYRIADAMLKARGEP
jgi:hypothetical protein